MQQLKIGSTLQGGKYKIESVLGQGGFGITYLANQEMLDRKVCIKEFFFKEYCERDEATSQVSLGTQNNKEMVRYNDTWRLCTIEEKVLYINTKQKRKKGLLNLQNKEMKLLSLF